MVNVHAYSSFLYNINFPVITGWNTFTTCNVTGQKQTCLFFHCNDSSYYQYLIMKKFLNTATKMAKFQFVPDIPEHEMSVNSVISLHTDMQNQSWIFRFGPAEEKCLLHCLCSCCCHLCQQHTGAHSVKPTTANKANS